MEDIKNSIKEKLAELKFIKNEFARMDQLVEKYEQRSETLRNEIDILLSIHQERTGESI